MSPARSDRVFVYSALLHAALLAALGVRPSRPLVFPVADPPAQVDIDLTGAPPLPPLPPATPSIASVAAVVSTPSPAMRPVVAPRAPGTVALRPVALARTASVMAPALAPPGATERILTAPPEAHTPDEAHLPAPISAASLFRGARGDVAQMDVGTPPSGAPAEARALERVRAASQGYLAEVVADANPLEPSQVHAYYGALARRMRETWRPGFYRTPSMVDTLLAMPRHMAQYQRIYSARAANFATTGRPDDPAAPLVQSDFRDRSTYSTRTTLTIVEVEQNENGAVTAVRVVRSAGIRDFDDAAMTAVRDAIPQQTPLHIPGGRRSRWEFDVAVSRDAVVPMAGLTFNESNGFFEMNYPGALHVRSRVRPAGSRRLDVPWPPPPVRVDE